MMRQNLRSLWVRCDHITSLRCGAGGWQCLFINRQSRDSHHLMSSKPNHDDVALDFRFLKRATGITGGENRHHTRCRRVDDWPNGAHYRRKLHVSSSSGSFPVSGSSGGGGDEEQQQPQQQGFDPLIPRPRHAAVAAHGVVGGQADSPAAYKQDLAK